MLPRIVKASKFLRIYNRLTNRCVHIGNANVIGTPIDSNDPEYQVIWACLTEKKSPHFLHSIFCFNFFIGHNETSKYTHR